MKLRIRGNTLRIRLTQGEIEQLIDTGESADQIDFGTGGCLRYVVQFDDTEAALVCQFSGPEIIVRIPHEVGVAWAKTEQVSLRSAVDYLPSVLIEKDFACLVPRQGEDDSDTFPNPRATS